MTCIPPDLLFATARLSHLRGNSRKLAVQYSRTSVRQHFFSRRVVDHWNSLPESTVTANTLDAFRLQLRNAR